MVAGLPPLWAEQLLFLDSAAEAGGSLGIRMTPESLPVPVWKRHGTLFLSWCLWGWLTLKG